MKKYKDLDDSEKSVIDGLTDIIHKLEKQVEDLYPYKERFEMAVRTIKGLELELKRKHGTIRISERKEEGIYIKQIVKLDDTPEGLFIEIS
jgi:hypothetical protein